MRLSRFNPPRTTPVSQMKFHPGCAYPAAVCALFLGVSAFTRRPQSEQKHLISHCPPQRAKQ